MDKLTTSEVIDGFKRYIENGWANPTVEAVFKILRTYTNIPARLRDMLTPVGEVFVQRHSDVIRQIKQLLAEIEGEADERG